MPLGPDLNKFIKVFNLPIRDYTRLSVKDTQSAIEDYLDSLSSDADARKLQAKNNFPKLLAQYKKEGKVKRVPTEKGGFKKDPTAPKPKPTATKPKPKKSPPPKPDPDTKERVKIIRKKIPAEKPPRTTRTKTPPSSPPPSPKPTPPKMKKEDSIRKSKLKRRDQRTFVFLKTPTKEERDKAEADRIKEKSNVGNITIKNLVKKPSWATPKRHPALKPLVVRGNTLLQGQLDFKAKYPYLRGVGLFGDVGILDQFKDLDLTDFNTAMDDYGLFKESRGEKRLHNRTIEKFIKENNII